MNLTIFPTHPSRIRPTTLILILSLALTACSARPAASDFDPAQSGIYVTGEKTVTSAAVEKLENDYYDEAELQSEVADDLAAFNTSMNAETPSAPAQSTPQAQPATLKSCTVTDGEAKLLIDFQTPESYVRYTEQYGDEDGTNRITWLDVTDTTDALAKGYFSEVSLIKPAGDTKTVPPETVAKENLTVIAVKGAGPVQTEGKIRYVSNNVKVTGSTEAQTPEDGISVIVFQ